MLQIGFWVPGRAQPAGSKRGFVCGDRAVVVDANAKAGDWKNDVRRAAGEAMKGFPLTREPVSLSLYFALPRPKAHFDSKGRVKPRFINAVPQRKPDTTKLLRGVEDALSGVIYVDDTQVYHLSVSRHYSPHEGVGVCVCTYGSTFSSTHGDVPASAAQGPSDAWVEWDEEQA